MAGMAVKARTYRRIFGEDDGPMTTHTGGHPATREIVELPKVPSGPAPGAYVTLHALDRAVIEAAIAWHVHNSPVEGGVEISTSRWATERQDEMRNEAEAALHAAVAALLGD